MYLTGSGNSRLSVSRNGRVQLGAYKGRWGKSTLFTHTQRHIYTYIHVHTYIYMHICLLLVAETAVCALAETGASR